MYLQLYTVQPTAVMKNIKDLNIGRQLYLFHDGAWFIYYAHVVIFIWTLKNKIRIGNSILDC